MAPQCWIIGKEDAKLSIDEAEKLGVFYRKLDHTKYEDKANAELEALCEEKGYTFRDFVDSSKMQNLAAKLDNFKTEHLHDDDEIRFFLGGSGYFDVKNKDDEFLRIHCFPGDLICLPRGVYHRFMPDESMSFFVMRLFCGDPVWTPHNRSGLTDTRQARVDYVKAYLPHLSLPAVYKLDDPTQAVSFARLEMLGVFYKKMNPAIYENDPELEALCKEKGYTYRDIVDSSKMANLEEKLDHFKVEHIHDDDEIRYFTDGSGYFDVKDLDDSWIRIHCGPGDFVTLPAGIYHRFVPDETLKFHVVRFFVGAPVWTPHNRGTETDAREARRQYVAKFSEPAHKKQKA